MTGRMQNKVALVTGAANGLGAAIAWMLAREGAAVIATDIDETALTTTVNAMTESRLDAVALRLDTSSEDDWRTVVDQVRELRGRLDAAVNCAGISIARSNPAETTIEQWRSLMTVNLDGVFLGTKHALRLMQDNKPSSGSIINVSSIMGMVALPDMAAYSASKGGVRLYSKSVALSCAQRQLNIRVNSVHPGFIDTPLLRRAMNRFHDADEAQRYYEAFQPVGHLGTPDDVAYAVLYLASDESSFVTGSELVVDGGYSAR